MRTIHLRVNDSATGKPTPVRLCITVSDGQRFVPFGAAESFPVGVNEQVGGQVRIGREHWTYIDGSCEIPLPAETPLRFQATKGPTYRPIETTFTLGPGQMAIRLTIERSIPIEGWVSGDCRAHFLSPHAALLEAAAEDLNFVELLALQQIVPSWDGHAYLMACGMTAFSGQSAALAADTHCVSVNTYHEHPVLGSLALLHTHRPVFPLAFGGEASDDWSLADWCDQAHRKGGLAIWVEPFRVRSEVSGGEALAAAILGKIDAVEFDPLPRPQPFLPSYYRLLNTGLKLPLVGSSGKRSNATVLGSFRTYARPTEPGSRGWIEAIRAGRTFMTNGPILDFLVNDQPPGSRLGNGEPLSVVARATSLTPFDRLELIHNGQIIASADVAGDSPSRAELRQTFTDLAGGWLAVRAVGEQVLAHSSPVWFGTPIGTHDPLLDRSLQATHDWIKTHGRFEHEKSRTHLIEVVRQARTRLPGRMP